MRCTRPVGGGPVIALLDLVRASAELLPPMRDGWRQNKLFAIHAVEMSETQARSARTSLLAVKALGGRRRPPNSPQTALCTSPARQKVQGALMEAATTKR
jgi:hypothetical protein